MTQTYGAGRLFPMGEIKSKGLCIMGCGRVGTHRQNMYCEWCYNTARRGGFDKKPYRTYVHAARDRKTGRVIRKGFYRTQWKSVRDDGNPTRAFVTLAEIRQATDPRPRCEHPGCTNLRRRKGLCDTHNGAAKARRERYRAEGVIKDRNAVQKQKLRQRQAA